MDSARSYEVVVWINVKKTGEINNSDDLEKWHKQHLEQRDIIHVEWVEAEFNDDTEFEKEI